jgi:peptidoglycan-associated lipoprotein
MIQRPFLALSAILVCGALLTGCSSTGTRSADAGAAVEDRGSASGTQTTGARAGGAWTGNPLEDPNSPLYTRVIYFDFDQSEIRPEYYPALRAHADYLIQNQQLSLVIEGHADERGSREYNVALGERRAQSVLRFLEAEGVGGSQLRDVSYGEERPSVSGYGEAVWSQNRRVELVY